MSFFIRRILVVLFILISFFLGWYGHKTYSFKNGDAYTKLTKVVRESAIQYNFTNPSLFTDNSAAIFSELDPLKESIEDLKSEAVYKGYVKNISVYFRDLNSTRWTGVGEDELFDPASLQKLVLLVAYIQTAEDVPGILTKKLLYNGKTDQDSFYKSEHLLKKGVAYPVSDLLVDMIVKSGNDSTAVLFDNIDKNRLARIYKDLEFSMPQNGTIELISPRVYSRLFRVLYNSTYLEWESSEQVLSLLSQTEFNSGLKALLPSDIKVSHKFGERSTTLSGGQIERQLHDCGIIYYPGHPYLLCVMTKGSDFSKLESAIAEVSDITYKYWDSLYK